jgi:hypothetical protein
LLNPVNIGDSLLIPEFAAQGWESQSGRCLAW